MKKIYGVVALTIASGFLLPAQVINGDFQAAGPGSCVAGASWTTAAGTQAPQYVTEGTNAWIDMTPCSSFGNGAYIEQQITTVPGQTYHIEMDIATCFGWQIWDTGFEIEIDGIAINSGATRVFYSSFDTSVPGAMKWTTIQSSTFSATSSLTTLRITGSGSNPQNPNYQQPAPGPGVMGLDNVVLKVGAPVTALTEVIQADLKIFPNPATDEFTVLTGKDINSDVVLLTDISGSVVVRSTGTKNISVRELAAGIYFVHLGKTAAIHPLKLVVTR